MLTKVVVVKKGGSVTCILIWKVFCLLFLLSHIKSKGEEGEDGRSGDKAEVWRQE